MAGIAVERRERAGPRRAQQASWPTACGSKSAGGRAFSGRRPGMAPGNGGGFGASSDHPLLTHAPSVCFICYGITSIVAKRPHFSPAMGFKPGPGGHAAADSC